MRGGRDKSETVNGGNPEEVLPIKVNCDYAVIYRANIRNSFDNPVKASSNCTAFMNLIVNVARKYGFRFMIVKPYVGKTGRCSKIYLFKSLDHPLAQALLARKGVSVRVI